MAKQNTQQRTRVKDLPKKQTKLTAQEMKKVKGGGVTHSDDWETPILIKAPKPPTIK